ncbi:MAG: TonB-dependent receptor plug domain-containing protein, partial [Acidimicrobiia bacterium]|nr:TonB-dependent receptor plug domain-containing protein [Acidimicrobiia bacterium]
MSIARKNCLVTLVFGAIGPGEFKMTNHRVVYGAVAAACLSWAVFSAPVLAQDQTAAGASDLLAFDEIIVTARKREETLIDVPMSITAISDVAIQAAGLRNLQDISFVAPGLDFQNQGSFFGGRSLSQISFRGMNLERVTLSNQLGALFIDGIYVLGGAQSVPLTGIERVEVIKGPQNAYFGRNTFAGAINYITRRPGDECEGTVSAE